MDEFSEKPTELLEEAEHGRSERTPWLALSGVTIAIAALVTVVLVLAFAVYLLA